VIKSNQPRRAQQARRKAKNVGAFLISLPPIPVIRPPIPVIHPKIPVIPAKAGIQGMHFGV
jgi:hypothetical protein